MTVVDRTDVADDEGLAAERTALAYNRSGLAAVVCIAVLLRRVWPLSSTSQYVATGLVAFAAAVWAVVLWVLTSARPGRRARVPAGPGALLLLTGGTLVLAVVAFILAFFVPA